MLPRSTPPRLGVEGDRAEAGQSIVRLDLDEIRAAGYDPVTPVVVTNAEEHPVRDVAGGRVEAGEPLFEASS